MWLGWAWDSGVSSPDFVGGETWVSVEGEVLYAVWQAISSPNYTVVYSGNGSMGGSVPIDSGSPYYSGSSVVVLGNMGNLVKTGFRFLGWNANSSATVAQYVAGNTFTINSNTVLYAIWKQTFTVIYNGNGNNSGTAPNDSNSPYDVGVSVTVLGNTGNLAKNNYTFKGWNTNQTNATNGVIQYTAGQTFTINANTTLYAVWAATPSTTYTVIYNGNGHTNGTAPTDNNSPYQSGFAVAVLGQGTLAKSNYVFLGWNTNQSQANNGAVQYTQGQTFTINSNTTLYAVWIIARTVIYNGNGQTSGVAPSDSNSPYNNGSSVTVLGQGTLLKTNYVFKGWNSDQSQANSGVVQYTQGQTFNIAVNTILYAVWGPVSSGGGFDGGTITSPLEIMCKFPTLNKTWLDALNWMNNAPDPSNYDAYLRFTNKNPSPVLSTDIYGVAFKDGSSYEAGIGINDSLFVRSKLYAKEAGIGGLSVPSKLQVDSIESFEPTSNYLTIKPNSGKTIKLDGNVQITGNLTGGGQSSGGTFNGGEIYQPLEIKSANFLSINGNNPPSVRDWMYAEPADPAKNFLGDWPAYTNALSPGIGIRFAEASGGFTDLYPFKTSKTVGIAVNHHLFVRKDFNARGMIDSREGILVLHGNGPGAIPPQNGNPGNKTWNIGWGPRNGGAPFIWLAEGGDRLGGEDGIGGNPVAETLLIVTNNDPSLHDAPDGLSGFHIDDPNPTGKYKWGHLECGNIIARKNLTVPDTVNTSHLKSRTSQPITLHSNLVPNANMSLDLGEQHKAYDHIYGIHMLAGDVTISGGGALYTDSIAGIGGSNTPLIIHSGSPSQPIILQGNTEVTGNLTVSGTINGGTSGGGGSIIRAGQATTESNGEKTIQFPSGTFTSVPIVTATVIDNSSQAYTVKVVAVSKNDFTVKIFRHRHRHYVGNTGTSTTFGMYYMAPLDVFNYQPRPQNNNANHEGIGGVVAPSTGLEGHPIYAGYTDESCFSGVGAQPSAEPVGGVKFNWIATPQTP